MFRFLASKLCREVKINASHIAENVDWSNDRARLPLHQSRASIGCTPSVMHDKNNIQSFQKLNRNVQLSLCTFF